MRPRLAQLHQSGAADGQVVAWDDTLMRWVPADPAGGALALDDLTDVDTTTTPPTGGQALVFDDASGLWVPGDGAAAPNGLPTGGADGQVLTKQSATDYDAAWETPSSGSSAILRGVLPFQPGRWYEAQVSTDYSVNVTTASGLALYNPLWLVAAATLDRIAINVTTAVAGSTVKLGLYADNGTGKPGALIADYGSVSTATTGAKTLTISQAVPAGLVWLVTLTLGGAPLLSAHVPTDADSYPNGFTNAFDTTGALGWSENALATLPATAAPTVFGTFRPRIMVRAA